MSDSRPPLLSRAWAVVWLLLVSSIVAWIVVQIVSTIWVWLIVSVIVIVVFVVAVRWLRSRSGRW